MSVVSTTQSCLKKELLAISAHPEKLRAYVLSNVSLLLSPQCFGRNLPSRFRIAFFRTVGSLIPTYIVMREKEKKSGRVQFQFNESE